MRSISINVFDFSKSYNAQNFGVQIKFLDGLSMPFNDGRHMKFTYLT